MLKWNSDVWGKLTGPYSSAENVSVLLQQLIEVLRGIDDLYAYLP